MKSLELEKVLSETRVAVGRASALIRANWDRPKTVRHKGRIDLVTETDLAVEAGLRADLGDILPEAEFVAEESYQGSGHWDSAWIVDPLDGTTNFTHNIPFVAVSVALWQGGRPVLGLVDLPMLNETFSALEGRGAFLNGSAIRVSKAETLEQSLVVTGFPYDITNHLDAILKNLGATLARAQGVRRLGAAAVDLAYVACGRFDAFYEAGLKPWDTAAGTLLVQEAGGRVSRYDQGPYRPGDPTMLATNGRIHSLMSGILAA
ncbi:MAG: inositol monophosphatase family protein [Desulfovibrionaceae bacterium]|nr:inositol monophosphatase [Desulfovibrionaceae bacterium]MDD4952223.1 inositol monophosphatase family protein [Desulfovibrionaceae bacterium]